MDRPTDRDAAIEARLAALVPAAPSAALKSRVAAALAAAPARPAAVRWLAERLLWAGAGAVAASLALTLAPAVAPPVAPPAATAADRTGPAAAEPVAATEPPVEVAEEAVAWADAGIQFLDDQTPARILRRVAVERHRPAGGAEYRVPREDVILMPVALR